MTCTNGACEYRLTEKRILTIRRTKDEIRYGQLWAEISYYEHPSLTALPRTVQRTETGTTKVDTTRNPNLFSNSLSDKNRTTTTKDKQKIEKVTNGLSDNRIGQIRAPVSILYSPHPLRTTSLSPSHAHALPKQEQVFRSFQSRTVEIRIINKSETHHS